VTATSAAVSGGPVAMGVRRILTGALTAPLLLLSACGGGDSVADPPISSAPTSSEPTHPAKHESPEAFIRRWANAEKSMENTGETGPYLQISDKCKACRGLAHDIRAFYAAGGFARWGGWKILNISRSGPVAGGTAYSVRVISRPTTYRKSAHAAIQHLAGGSATHQITLRQVDGEWQVVGKAQLST
jgi:hypothetical protein